MSDRQSLVSVFFSPAAILSLLTVLGCSSLPEWGTTLVGAPGAIEAPVYAIPVSEHEMPLPKTATPSDAAAPVTIQEPAALVHDPGTI